MRRLTKFLWAHRFQTTVVLVLSLILLGNKGFRNLIHRALELRRLRRELVSLRREETTLNEQIRRIQKDDFAVEKAVRRELDYVKPGEIEYRFPPPKAK